MKVFMIVCVCCGLLSEARAASWYHTVDVDNPSETLHAGPESAATREQCTQLAAWGRCSFYDCLESKFPCGANGYTQKISKHFCSKIDADYSSFDAFGKRWLNRTSICLLQYMTPIYRQAASSCQDIKDAGIEAIIHCNDGQVDGQNFCDFLNTNGDAYSNLMGMDEVQLIYSLRDTRVFRSMVTDAVTCGVSNLADFASSAGNYVSGLVSRAVSFFWE